MTNIQIVSIAISRKKGTKKAVTDQAVFIKNHGLENDAHAGDWHRQVSFLASEHIDAERKKGLDVTFGDFAENIATTGIDWKSVPVGSRFNVGQHAVIEITQIGKKCHRKCDIYHQAGDCIMPREGVFARVIEGGEINTGDTITLNGPGQPPQGC